MVTMIAVMVGADECANEDKVEEDEEDAEDEGGEDEHERGVAAMCDACSG